MTRKKNRENARKGNGNNLETEKSISAGKLMRSRREMEKMGQKGERSGDD